MAEGKKKRTHWTKELKPGEKTAVVSRPKGQPKYYPTKFTKEIRETILKYISMCASYEDACTIAGISSESVRRWRKLGAENPMSEYGAFAREIEQARAKALHGLVARIVRAGHEGNWKAAAFLLTHLDGERFGNRVKVEQTVTMKNALEGRSAEDCQFWLEHKRWPEEKEPS